MGHEAADVHHDEDGTERNGFGSIQDAVKNKKKERLRSQEGARVMCLKNRQQGMCMAFVASLLASEMLLIFLLSSCCKSVVCRGR